MSARSVILWSSLVLSIVLNLFLLGYIGGQLSSTWRPLDIRLEERLPPDVEADYRVRLRQSDAVSQSVASLRSARAKMFELASEGVVDPEALRIAMETIRTQTTQLQKLTQELLADAILARPDRI